jgi:Protein of unknown function (DUF2934)
MPHFCARTHSTRDRRLILAVGDQPASMASLAVAAPANPNPTHEQIAALAYSYWEARGRQNGSAEADWLRAEQQLRRQ